MFVSFFSPLTKLRVWCSRSLCVFLFCFAFVVSAKISFFCVCECKGLRKFLSQRIIFFSFLFGILPVVQSNFLLLFLLQMVKRFVVAPDAPFCHCHQQKTRVPVVVTFSFHFFAVALQTPLLLVFLLCFIVCVFFSFRSLIFLGFLVSCPTSVESSEFLHHSIHFSHTLSAKDLRYC